MPVECADDETGANVNSYGWNGYEDVTWTITNLITGEEFLTGGDLQNNSSQTYACFPDGVYELTACDMDSGEGWADDWYVDIPEFTINLSFLKHISNDNVSACACPGI